MRMGDEGGNVINLYFDVSANQWITRVISIHNDVDNVRGNGVCTKFHGNSSKSCRDISLKGKNVNLLVVIQVSS